jgi:hypothetical protein
MQRAVPKSLSSSLVQAQSRPARSPVQYALTLGISRPARRLSGGAEAALKLVTRDATFEAQGPQSVPIYGRFEGHDGALL